MRAVTFFLRKLQKRLAEAVFFGKLPRGGKVPLARAAVLDAASTMGNYDTAISGLIEHKEDTKIHVTAEEKASWTEGAEQAAADANRVTEALNAIAGIESRVSRVEDGLFNNITGNPFLASFDSLDGITLVKGIWNEERKRIEC